MRVESARISSAPTLQTSVSRPTSIRGPEGTHPFSSSPIISPFEIKARISSFNNPGGVRVPRAEFTAPFLKPKTQKQRYSFPGEIRQPHHIKHADYFRQPKSESKKLTKGTVIFDTTTPKSGTLFEFPKTVPQLTDQKVTRAKFHQRTATPWKPIPWPERFRSQEKRKKRRRRNRRRYSKEFQPRQKQRIPQAEMPNRRQFMKYNKVTPEAVLQIQKKSKARHDQVRLMNDTYKALLETKYYSAHAAATMVKRSAPDTAWSPIQSPLSVSLEKKIQTVTSPKREVTALLKPKIQERAEKQLKTQQNLQRSNEPVIDQLLTNKRVLWGVLQLPKMFARRKKSPESTVTVSSDVMGSVLNLLRNRKETCIVRGI